MSDHRYPPTPEQSAILEACQTTSRNILVQALAGAAKTSTLVLIAEHMRKHPMLCVAFNKRIADEMSKRLPDHCVAKTLNSIGHTAWRTHTGKNLTLNSHKLGDIVKGLPLSRSEKEELSDVFGDIIQLASRAKLFGYIPHPERYPTATPLYDRETLEQLLAENEYPSLGWFYLDQILHESISQAFEGTIDYDDQLYMSTLFGAQLPRFPITMVDEAQDLSPLNHYMIERLVGNRRLIAVGDHYQSIYGFRGAVSDGMSVLRNQFDMEEFRLSISFRCPKEIVRLARERAPYMQYAANAAEGLVVDLTNLDQSQVLERLRLRQALTPDDDKPRWGPGLFPHSAAVVCRNNAPLFSLGLKLLKAGRGVSIRGFEISKRLLKVLREFGDFNMARDEVLEHLSRWRIAKIAEGKISLESIEDRYACMVVFAEATPTLGSAISHAERLFASTGAIELLSGHKSKGLEWDDVFHLDPWRVPSPFAREGEALEQELNLNYVITTRAKRSLTFINLADYDPEEISDASKYI